MKHVKATDLFQLKSVTSPQFIPNTDQFTYFITQIDEKDNEYYTHLYRYDGQHQQLTHQKERISNVSHSPDGKSTLFIAKGAHDKPQVFLLPTHGGERQSITDEEMGVNSALFSSDGQAVYYHVFKLEDKEEEENDFPKPVVINNMKYKADSVGLLKEKYQLIKKINLETKEVFTVLEGQENYQLFASFNDYLVYSSDASDDRDNHFESTLFIRHNDTDTTIDLEAGNVFSVEVSKDQSKLLIVHMSRAFENASHPELYVYDIKTQTLKNISRSLDGPIGGLVISDFQQSVETKLAAWIDNESFIFLLSKDGNVNLYKGNIYGDINQLIEGNHHVYGFDVNDTSVVLAKSDLTHPGDLFLYDFNSKSLEQVSSINEAYLAETTFVRAEEIRYASEDGQEIHGWLMKPANFKEGEKYPLITNIHGGPHAFFANTFFHEVQLMAALGYGVLYVNPRGSHSYSQAFVDAVRGDYGNGDYTDIMSGVDYVLEHNDWIDDNRLGVTGGSYGGFMTNWIVGHTNRFKAAVTQRSISNWISFRGVSDIGYYFTDWQIQADFNDVETMWKYSPIKYVDNIETPLLIIHSERDFRCPIEQAEQLYIALKYQKKDTEFVRFQEADHNLSRTGKPNLRIERLNHIMNWFEKYLK